jgi:transposase
VQKLALKALQEIKIKYR